MSSIPSPPRDKHDPPEPTAYQPPAVIWEEKWEPLVLAASCARLPAQNEVCNASAHSP